jgi:hypothetical protein
MGILQTKRLYHLGLVMVTLREFGTIDLIGSWHSISLKRDENHVTIS